MDQHVIVSLRKSKSNSFMEFTYKQLIYKCLVSESIFRMHRCDILVNQISLYYMWYMSQSLVYTRRSAKANWGILCTKRGIRDNQQSHITVTININVNTFIACNWQQCNIIGMKQSLPTQKNYFPNIPYL